MKRNKKLIEGNGLDERCHDCGAKLPQGKGRMAFYCRTIGLCRYCYRHKYPGRGLPSPRPTTPGGQRLMSWSQRREMERAGFNEEVWSEEFREEMREYWKARMRGEC